MIYENLQTKDIILILFLLCPTFVFCQVKTEYYYPSTLQYGNSRIETKGWKQYNGSELVIRPESNTIDLMNDKLHQNFSLDIGNINTIEVQNGNRALLYGLIGAFSGLIAGAFLAPEMGSDAASWTVLIGSPVLCFSFGALIGTTQKKYKTVFSYGKFVE